MYNNLVFLPIDDDLLTALRDGEQTFTMRHGAALHDVRLVADVTAQMLALVTRPPWGGFLAVDNAQVIGTCAFKAAPDADGMVEIAYYTFPPFERRGYATAMAAELVRRASASPLVKLIIAHTLPERNPSTSVLQRNGFTFAGDVVDPEDGPVWRWEWGG